MTSPAHVKIGNFEVGNDLPLALIAGPCQMESLDHAMDMAGKLVDITSKLGMGLVYKTSFDKANRSSLHTERGLGIDAGLPVFERIKAEYKIPVLTDVHDAGQCAEVASVVDVIQIPAFLCRQTDLLIAAAKTGNVVNVKKGQFLAPWDMKHVANKLVESGNQNVLLTDRGTSFGYNTLVSDMRGLPIMAETGHPIVFDATHSVQQPGGHGTTSGGQREFVPVVARAAVAVGCAMVFMETHEDPDNAPSDGPNMVPIDQMEALLTNLVAFDKISKNL
ncbi:3-deoxy-8-phosphooctulonate synthase [Alphaproteobacteria bacterium 46_93_T64]|nr:3-deoxy-8-phosphooctulonate synthase [Alphaproteobacteria bacterium 46_93_T64]